MIGWLHPSPFGARVLIKNRPRCRFRWVAFPAVAVPSILLRISLTRMVPVLLRTVVFQEWFLLSSYCFLSFPVSNSVPRQMDKSAGWYGSVLHHRTVYPSQKSDLWPIGREVSHVFPWLSTHRSLLKYLHPPQKQPVPLYFVWSVL